MSNQDIQHKEKQIDVEKVLQKLASAVHERKMSVPAIFFLEMYKPLTGLFHALSVMSIPMLVPLFGAKLGQTALEVLESRDNVDNLILMLEEQR